MSVTVLHPTSTERPARFRLYRAGLIGLYEYEDETFEFERGRLLLRGPNGSGKSKALELLLPLLLDSELRAERLDPFGGRGRSMRWNLIGEQESRAPATGFSWLELHRHDAQGVEHFHTLVLMARANKAETGVNHHPISRAALAELAGELIESASAYRERVNALLFGVGQERYEAIVRLLLSLRKPQLSQTLDPQELSARLTESLPELDRDAVLRASDDWRAAERLEELRRLAETARAAAADAAAELDRAETLEVELAGAAERADAALNQQRAAVDSLLQACSAAAERAGVAAHEATVEGLVEEDRDLAAVRSLLDGSRHSKPGLPAWSSCPSTTRSPRSWSP